MHIRAPTGTRIKETAALGDRVENDIRAHIPPSELTTITDNIGLPYSTINLSSDNSGLTGTDDADILVSLAPNHRPTIGHVRELRRALTQDFPGVRFYDLPAAVVSKILDFGLRAPIDIQIVGRDLLASLQFADNLWNGLKFIPGVVDMRIQQEFDQPRLDIRIKSSADWLHRERRGSKPAGIAERQLSNFANLLARS